MAQPAPVVPPASDRQWQSDQRSLFRRLGFVALVFLVFLRFSTLHEIISYFAGGKTYLLYIIGAPALFGILATGGIRRAFQSKLIYCWVFFAIWMTVSTPFSFWRGGSAAVLFTYLRSELPTVFLIAGLTMGWIECKWLFSAIAAASLVAVVSFRMLGNIDQDRLGLAAGTIANPNDLAAHLIMILPFVAFFVLRPKTLLIFRLVGVATIVYGLHIVLSTASRGALVALTACFSLIFLRAPIRAKFAVAMVGPVLFIGLMALLPQHARNRILSFSSDEQADPEAIESGEVRVQELRKSIEYTLKNPIFGVGPGQFSSIEGSDSRQEGQHGLWHDTHNTYTQVSSECGIPALLAFIAVQVGSFVLLGRVNRRARRNPRYQEIALLTFCAMLSLVGACVATFFLSMAYRFYFPALTGLAIAMATAAEREFARDLEPAGQPDLSSASARFQDHRLMTRPAGFTQPADY